jgi:hypothetical protein
MPERVSGAEPRLVTVTVWGGPVEYAGCVIGSVVALRDI